MKLLVLTIEGYQDIELIGFVGTLKRSGKLEKVDYWNPNNLSNVEGVNKIGSIKTISNQININDYDSIFVPGGKACQLLRLDEKALNLIREFVDNNKWIFAICDGPNAIYENGILQDKKYSSYPIENINQTCGSNRTKEYISVDGKYISGKCPSAAIDLALKVIEVVFGKELAKKVYEDVYAIE